MKKSVVLTWLLWGSTIGSMMGNSFETAEDLKGVSGNVSISEEQYRFGTHALKWEARDGESIRIAMDGRKNRRREVSFHIYAMKPDPDTVLELQIGDPPRKGEYRVRIPLRFPYWQLVRVSPWEDLERIPVADARDEMVITYRGREPQTLYLDALQFVSSWQRVPNLLVPGANPKRPAMHGKTPGKKLLSAVLPQVEKWRQAPPPTPEEAQALQELRRRARSWLTDFGQAQDPRLKAARAAGILEEAEEAWRRYQALAIHTDDGRNFRFQSAPEPRDGYDMSWRDLATKTLLPLLYAVNVDMPGNRFYRNPEAIAAVVQLAGLMRYQGFAFGADHNWHVIFALRGMGQTLFLMQDTLREAGLLEDLAWALLWYSRVLHYAAIPEEDATPSADLLRATFIEAFLTALTLPDHEGNAVLHSLKLILDRQLRVRGGIEDFIKPDGSAFHHGQVAHGFYGPDGLHGAAALAYLLDGTPYQLDAAALQQLRRALLTLDRQQSQYDTPTVTSIRWPFLGGMAKPLVSALAYWLLTHPEDTEAGAVFRRLYQPDVLVTEYRRRTSYQNVAGEGQITGAAARLTREITPAEPPEGCFNYPYSALLIHRRDDWMAVIRGFSKYAWDFEVGSRKKGGYENRYGRFLSHGRLQLFAPGKNAAESGLVDSGWDFCHHPGTTALVMPVEELELPDRRPVVYGRSYSTETLVGGGTIDGRDGVYGFALRDTLLPEFRAFKSYHLCGRTIVCLGSGISNPYSDYETDTTLFQNFLGETFTPGAVVRKKVAGGEWLTDSRGTCYYLPEGQDLQVHYGMQRGPDERGGEIRQGLYEKAWLRHGRAPEAAGYEYAVFMAPEPGSCDSAPHYRVLQKDHRAHVVYFPEKRLYSAVVAVPDAELPKELPVASLSAPALLLCREEPSGEWLISVTDPDFGWEGDLWEMPALLPESRTSRARLRGNWKSASEGARLSGTELQWQSVPGESREIRIRK